MYAKNLVPFIFGQDALAASQSAVALGSAIGEASQAVSGYPMPAKWNVRAIAWATSAAGSAGAASISATKGGTANSGTTMSLGTATQGIKRFRRGKMSGKAGDLLGVKVTTDGSWNGTSADLQVTVYVEFDLLGQ